MTTWGEPCQPHTQVRVRLFGQPEIWHRDGVEAIKYAEMLALRTEYGQFLARRDEPLDVQTYACRPIRGTTNTHSLHSWPRALDIRPTFNPLRDDGVLVTDFDKFGLKDAKAFVGAFLAAGFRWGGTWSHDPEVANRALARNHEKVLNGRVDTMHFELDRDPVTTGWPERLRAYRRKHPAYFTTVLRQAKASSAGELIERWRAGEA